MGWIVHPDVERKILEQAGERPRAGAPIVNEELSEKAFMSEVIRFAKRQGWRSYHVHDSRKSVAGFPDLVLVRDRVVWAELKTETGRVTADQQTWLDALGATRAEVYLWRPSDWPSIVEALR